MDNWIENLEASMSPEGRRNWERTRKVDLLHERLARAFRWYRWPVLRLVWTFWTGLMDGGIKDTCQPRWGALTFAYLNDGMKPSLWHTWQSLTAREDAGLYVHGAPINKAEADSIIAGEDDRYSNYKGREELSEVSA